MPKPYRGFLGREIDPDLLVPGLLFTGDRDEYWSKKLGELRAEALRHLAEHYGIRLVDPHFWPQLALALAHHFVPAFRLKAAGKRPPHRPKSWPPERRFELWAEMIRMKRAGHDDDGAMKLLTARPKWRGVTTAQMKRILRNKSEMGPLWTKILRRLQREGAPVEDWIVEGWGQKPSPKNSKR